MNTHKITKTTRSERHFPSQTALRARFLPFALPAYTPHTEAAFYLTQTQQTQQTFYLTQNAQNAQRIIFSHTESTERTENIFISHRARSKFCGGERQNGLHIANKEYTEFGGGQVITRSIKWIPFVVLFVWRMTFLCILNSFVVNIIIAQ